MTLSNEIFVHTWRKVWTPMNLCQSALSYVIIPLDFRTAQYLPEVPRQIHSGIRQALEKTLMIIDSP